MGKIHKFILFFILLFGILFSVGILSTFYTIPQVSGLVKKYLELYPVLYYVFSGFMAFVGLVFCLLLLIVLLRPSRGQFLTVQKEKGRIEYSKRTIESTVRYSFAQEEAVEHSMVRVKLHKNPSKIKIFVKLYVQDVSSLATITEVVYGKIQAMLQSSLEISVQQITIRVAEAQDRDTKKKEITEHRVV